MKTLMTALTVTLLLTTATGAMALGPLDAKAELGVYSKYVWRGLIANPEAVLQPELGLDFMGFGFEVWANMDLTDQYDLSGEFNEVDYTLYYDLALPVFKLGAGFIHYSYPNPDTDIPSTTEFYLYAGADVILSPRLAFYQDLDEVKGAYWEGAIGHGFQLTPTWTMDLEAILGLGSKSYMNGYFGLIPAPEELLEGTPFTGATVSNFQLSAAFPWDVLPIVSIVPSVAYTTLIGDAKDAIDGLGADSDGFVFGLSASVSF